MGSSIPGELAGSGSDVRRGQQSVKILDAAAKAEVDEVVASFFYGQGISHDVVSSQSFPEERGAARAMVRSYVPRVDVLAADARSASPVPFPRFPTTRTD